MNTNLSDLIKPLSDFTTEDSMSDLIKPLSDAPPRYQPRKPLVRFAVAYYIDRAYGGPEEGGWWYDVGEHLMSLPFFADEAPRDEEEYPYDEVARAAAEDRLKELCDAAGHDIHGQFFRVYIEDKPGADFPTERPHYE